MKSPNFYARMTYGNKKSVQSGIKNLHLNIRSIRNKMGLQKIRNGDTFREMYVKSEMDKSR